MNSDNNLINYILFAVIIAFLVHILFKNANSGENYEPVQVPLEMEERLQSAPIKRKRTDWRFVDYDEPSQMCALDKESRCPLPKNEEDTNIYLTKFLLGEREECPKPAKPIKQFHKDFFNFRDLTQVNTSIRMDAVDKIQQLYLQGNTSEARRYPNMKIKDIFDEVTKAPSLYHRQCVRLPKFENINYDGYYMSYGQHPMDLTRDNWRYSREKVINGAEISNGMYGNDPDANMNMPIFN